MHYHICVKGDLDSSWQDWCAPVQIRHEPSGTTILSSNCPIGPPVGVLLKLERLGITLLSLESGEERHDTDRAAHEA